jgi:hypothetical protein
MARSASSRLTPSVAPVCGPALRLTVFPAAGLVRSAGQAQRIGHQRMTVALVVVLIKLHGTCITTFGLRNPYSPLHTKNAPPCDGSFLILLVAADGAAVRIVAPSCLLAVGRTATRPHDHIKGRTASRAPLFSAAQYDFCFFGNFLSRVRRTEASILTLNLVHEFTEAAGTDRAEIGSIY